MTNQTVDFFARVDEDGFIKVPIEKQNLVIGKNYHIILEEESPKGKVKDIVAILNEYKDVKPFSDMDDPVAWQIKNRKEWDRNVFD
ncbi:MAG: hypothetical protein JJT78_16535 [Leptospira sp.]|nr:hypothetical protein [Leptospira sp.]